MTMTKSDFINFLNENGTKTQAEFNKTFFDNVHLLESIFNSKDVGLIIKTIFSKVVFLQNYICDNNPLNMVDTVKAELSNESSRISMSRETFIQRLVDNYGEPALFDKTALKSSYDCIVMYSKNTMFLFHNSSVYLLSGLEDSTKFTGLNVGECIIGDIVAESNNIENILKPILIKDKAEVKCISLYPVCATHSNILEVRLENILSAENICEILSDNEIVHSRSVFTKSKHKEFLEFLDTKEGLLINDVIFRLKRHSKVMVSVKDYDIVFTQNHSIALLLGSKGYVRVVSSVSELKKLLGIVS